jgi:S1-C subfamily serine protease
MSDRLMRFIVVALLIVLAVYVGQPYVDRLLFSASTPRAVAPRGTLSDLERSTIELFERDSPSVVQVVARAAALDASQGEGEAGGAQSGTGFVWDAAGHIVTNNHVVEGTDAVSVRLATGQVLRAPIVGTAPNYDLAVLRVSDPRSLPAPIAIGTSEDLKVGQSVFAIGNPFGLDQSLTTGIISALKRRLPTQNGREITNVIQTDAAINPGNSGGPLLDSAGRLIGVNTAILSPSGTSAGIGFAIPVDIVNRVVPEIISKGYVPTPGIGIVAGHGPCHRTPALSPAGRCRRRRDRAHRPGLLGRTRRAARRRSQQQDTRRRDRRCERQAGAPAAGSHRGARAHRRRQEGQARDQTRGPRHVARHRRHRRRPPSVTRVHFPGSTLGRFPATD